MYQCISCILYSNKLPFTNSTFHGHSCQINVVCFFIFHEDTHKHQTHLYKVTEAVFLKPVLKTGTIGRMINLLYLQLTQCAQRLTAKSIKLSISVWKVDVAPRPAVTVSTFSPSTSVFAVVTSPSTTFSPSVCSSLGLDGFSLAAESFSMSLVSCDRKKERMNE